MTSETTGGERKSPCEIEWKAQKDTTATIRDTTLLIAHAHNAMLCMERWEPASATCGMAQEVGEEYWKASEVTKLEANSPIVKERMC